MSKLDSKSVEKNTTEKAVVLLSGGLDSATVLAIAQASSKQCYALSFDYGQRHVAELNAATLIAKAAEVVAHSTLNIDLGAIGGSALTDRDIAVPELTEASEGIPITYVPARNTIMLSMALGWAEVLGANSIYTGVNAVDYSGYPDCRPEYIAAFQQMANLATRAAVEGGDLQIQTPLIELSKAEIIQQGLALGVDYSLTVSCYQADANGAACGRCDSCQLRMTGFLEAGVSDPTRYQ